MNRKLALSVMAGLFGLLLLTACGADDPYLQSKVETQRVTNVITVEQWALEKTRALAALDQQAQDHAQTLRQQDESHQLGLYLEQLAGEAGIVVLVILALGLSILLTVKVYLMHRVTMLRAHTEQIEREAVAAERRQRAEVAWLRAEQARLVAEADLLRARQASRTSVAGSPYVINVKPRNGSAHSPDALENPPTAN
jgi:hypothetical protein